MIDYVLADAAQLTAANLVAADPPNREPLAFHRRLPGYAPTPLVNVPAIAATLGVSKVWVKDESSRLGLPSFKIIGASWATYRAVAHHAGASLEPWHSLDELRIRLQPLLPLTLAAATDGNHGRAVARMAKLLGLSSRIFVPAEMTEPRIAAIASEGAEVEIVDGSYDDAVRRSAEAASDRCLVISDTSWPGYEETPRRVIEGYSTIFWEIEDELAARGEAGPDVVAVQMGVGALAASVIRHYRRPEVDAPVRLLGVEPLKAACVLASVRAGRIIEVPGPHGSIMAGLNAGLPSIIAFPLLNAGLDALVAIPDEAAEVAMRRLAAAGVIAGETGAAGLAGLTEFLTGELAKPARTALGMTAQTRVLLICTEGATDPAAYARIVGRAPGA